MIKIVKFISSSFTDGLRKLKVQGFGKSDVTTPYEASQFGNDGLPPKNWKAVMINTTIDGDKVIVGYINKKQLESLVEGENRVYSTDPDGVLSTFIYLRGDGTMEIGGDTDFMVRYSELETAFNQLKSDFDGLVTNYNAHMHPTAATGAPSPPTITGSPSTADITPAKIAEIKTT